MAKPRLVVTGGPTYHGLEFIQSKHPGVEQFVVTGASNRINVRDCLFPVVANTDFGQPAVLFRGTGSPFGPGDGHVFLVRHTEQGQTAPAQQLFPHDTFAYGLVQYAGALLAICQNTDVTTPGDLIYRLSYDSGLTWSDPALLGLGFARTFIDGIGSTCPALWVATDKAGKNLYLFYYNSDGSHKIMYRTTGSLDPTQGWTAEAYTGITTVVPNFNQGNDTAEGQRQRSFVFCETNSPGVWAAAYNDGTGSVGDNKSIYSGTLGGVWTREQLMGFGGGIVGGSGGTGGVFLDKNGLLYGYAMSDPVDLFTVYNRDRFGAWANESNEVPPSPIVSFGAGQGLYIPSYDKLMIWGHARADGSLRVLVVDNIALVTKLGGGT